MKRRIALWAVPAEKSGISDRQAGDGLAWFAALFWGPRRRKNVARDAGCSHSWVLLTERWLSGLRRTPGKREYLNSTVGSNPSLSASFQGVFTLILRVRLHW